MNFEWNDRKNTENINKHGISFDEAQEAFFDKKRIMIRDDKHSFREQRFFCIGDTGRGIATVRFTIRKGNIRIFGAGYWREGKKRYDKAS